MKCAHRFELIYEGEVTYSYCEICDSLFRETPLIKRKPTPKSKDVTKDIIAVLDVRNSLS